MRRISLRLLLLSTTAVFSGCGTMTNLIAPGPLPDGSVGSGCLVYGGVNWDVHAAFFDLTDDDEKMTALGLTYLAIDGPLSLVADTATLPITVPVTLYRKHKWPDAHPLYLRERLSQIRETPSSPRMENSDHQP